MTRIPETTFIQSNASDKLGNVAATRNINFDEKGYAKLSPRTVAVADETDNADIGVPLAISRYSSDDYHILTDSDDAFTVELNTTSLSKTENDGSGQQSYNSDSHATFWQGKWYASNSTDDVYYREISGGADATWVDAGLTGLTSGLKHILRVFENRQTLTVTNGNKLKQYTTGHASSTDLTIPSDFEIVGTAYNAQQMGIITRLGNATDGQGREAYFFVWDGATTAANNGVGLGANSGVGICAYKSSFAVLNQCGQLLYWNGGGLEILDALPFYFTDKVWGDLLNQEGLGDIMTADGERIYINLGLQLESFGRTRERTFPKNPSGVWCFDPEVGLYHRASPSISKAYSLTVSSVDSATDILTVSSGTIPDTGNPIRYTAAGTVIGGLSLHEDYYVIKVSSTTFKLATTKVNALNGTAINLTSTGSSSFFWAFDLVDYGNTYHDTFGAVALTGSSSTVSGPLIFGGSYETTALIDRDVICASIPFLENRGYYITSKVLTDNALQMTNTLVVRHRPLATDDAIVVKVKTQEVEGLPISSTGVPGGTWSDTNRLYVAEDLSLAKEYLDAGGEIELEVISGAGAGTLVQVESIEGGDSLYDIVLAEDVLGASNGRKCNFILDNWKLVDSITNSSQTTECSTVMRVDEAGPWIQFKIELRGWETAVQELIITDTKYQDTD